MKKGRFIILIMSVVFLVCSVVPSYAEQKSGWYSSEITLALMSPMCWQNFGHIVILVQCLGRRQWKLHIGGCADD